MKTLNTNTMKLFKGLFFAACIAVLTFGCEKEMIRPEGNAAPEATCFPYAQRPPVQCGSSVFATMNDGASSLGTVEILNNSSDLYLIFNLNMGRYLEEVKIYNGDVNNMPLDADGNVQMEQFGFQQLLSSPANDYTLTFPLSGMSSCTDIMIWARISTRNLFGQVIATDYAWMSGTPASNGFSTNFCVTSCITTNTGTGSSI
jgi:hypothetical protein